MPQKYNVYHMAGEQVNNTTIQLHSETIE